MLAQILFFNISHFMIYVFSAFTFFATGLLYFDTRHVNKTLKTPTIRSLGFFSLAFVSLIQIITINSSVINLLIQLINVIGLLLILSSLVNEPVLKKPNVDKNLSIFIPLFLPALTVSLIPLSGVLYLVIAFSYLRKSTKGLEKQLKPASLAFLILAFAEFTHISKFWIDTSSVFWSKMFSDFGPIWITKELLILSGSAVLLIWVWGYIRFRLRIQMFISIVGSTLFIFVVTTFLFTFLLLKNLEADILSNLKTNVNVLQYSMNSLQMETLSHAKAVAQDSDFEVAEAENNKSLLYEITSDFMISQETDFLAVVSETGEVVARAEDKDQIGNNLSEDTVVKSALSGSSLSTVITSSGVIQPEIQIKSAVPTKNGGAVITGFVIDNAFVDGVKEVTGLDVTVFSGNKRAATTLVDSDNKSRFIGTEETNNKIINTVLEKGETYLGTNNIFNRPFYSAYSPLKSYGDTTIGMISVGKPQITIFETAQKSINLTFLGSIILILISIAPVYFLSKYLEENTKV